MSADPNQQQQQNYNGNNSNSSMGSPYSNGSSATGSPIQSPVHDGSYQGNPYMSPGPMSPQPPNSPYQQGPPPPQQHQGQHFQGGFQQGPPQGFQQAHGYPPQGFQQGPPQGYPPQGFPQGPPQGYPQPGFQQGPPQGYPPQSYQGQFQQGVPPQGYQGYPPMQQDQFYQGPHPPQNFYPPPAFDPQYQIGGYGGYSGFQAPIPPQRATQDNSSNSVEPNPPAKFYALTADQLNEFKEKMQSRFRQNMPFDWIGQADIHWYSSWCLSQENFVAFRIFLSVYAYWCWQSFSKNVYDFSWTPKMEMMMDPSSLFRTYFLWLALLSVFIGIFGSTVMSLAQLTVPQHAFKRLAAYKYYSSFMGKWRNWAVFGLNYHYDAAPTLACIPIILLIVPGRLYPLNVSQSAWPAITLPLFVMMDLWIVKRCRMDSTYIRRNIFAAIVVLTAGTLIWASYYYKIFRPIFAIRSVNGIMEDFAPTLLTAWGFAVFATICVDLTFNFLRFKVDYLLNNHYDKLSVRDIREIVKENDEYYSEKHKQFSIAFEEQQARIAAEMGAYYASLAAQYDQPQEMMPPADFIGEAEPNPVDPTTHKEVK